MEEIRILVRHYGFVITQMTVLYSVIVAKILAKNWLNILAETIQLRHYLGLCYRNYHFRIRLLVRHLPLKNFYY